MLQLNEGRVIDLKALRIEGGSQKTLEEQLGLTPADFENFKKLISMAIADRVIRSKGEAFSNLSIIERLIPVINPRLFVFFAITGITEPLNDALDNCGLFEEVKEEQSANEAIREFLKMLNGKGLGPMFIGRR